MSSKAKIFAAVLAAAALGAAVWLGVRREEPKPPAEAPAAREAAKKPGKKARETAPVKAERAFPGEVLGAVKIENTGVFYGENEEKPFAGLLDKPEIREFFAPAIENFENFGWWERVKETTGLDKEEVKKLFPGQVAAAVMPTDLKGETDSESAQPLSYAVAAEFTGGYEKLREIVEKIVEENSEEKKEIRVAQEEYLGVPLLVEKILEGEVEHRAWALADGLALVALPPDFARDCVARLKGRKRNTLLEDDGFLKAREYCRDADAYFYLNLDPLTEWMNAELNAMRKAPAPGLTGKNLAGVLRLDVMERFCASVKAEDDGLLIRSGLLYEEQAGLLRLLACEEGEFPRPPFVPPRAVSVNSGLFDFGRAWEALEDLAGRAAPGLLQQSNGFFRSFKEESGGIDIKTSIIKNLGPEVIFFAVRREPPETEKDTPGYPALYNQVIAFSVGDRQNLEMAIEGIKAMAAPGQEWFEKRDYLGVSLYLFKNPRPVPNQQQLAYAVTRDYLLISIGSLALLEETVSRLRNPGRSLWDDLEKENIGEYLDRPAAGFAYQDLNAGMKTLFETLIWVQTAVFGKGDNRFCNPQAQPEAFDLPYEMVARTSLLDGGLIHQMKIFRKNRE